MPKFMFAYHGGKRPESEEEIKSTMAAWEKWITENQKALLDPGNPVGTSRTVTDKEIRDDGGSNPLSGYTIVDAADIDAACAIAKSNPMVIDGSGSVEIAEIIQM